MNEYQKCLLSPPWDLETFHSANDELINGGNGLQI